MALQPPFISIPGIPNFRTLGPLPLTINPSKVFRPHIIYRSVEPSGITIEGEQTFQKLGITHVYDLRSNVEIQRHVPVSTAPKTLPGSQRVFVPIFPDEDYSPEKIAGRFQQYGSPTVDGFVEAYKTILAAAAEPYAIILRHLAKPEGKDVTPLLIHCTAGKDRTGLICAILLSLCGVDDEAVAKEYALTEQGLVERREVIIQHVLQNPGLKGDRAAAERMIASKAESMIASLQMLREQYGSVEEYITNHCGLSEDEVERIKQNLIIDASAVEALKPSL